jgi:hypothetical protein
MVGEDGVGCRSMFARMHAGGGWQVGMGVKKLKKWKSVTDEFEQEPT